MAGSHELAAGRFGDFRDHRRRVAIRLTAPNGLITAVATASDAVLVVAHMNIAALAMTPPTGEAHCWSRSHVKLLPKGAASGHIRHAAEMRIDFHEDTIWLQIEPAGPAGQTVATNYFYRRVGNDGPTAIGDKK